MKSIISDTLNGRRNSVVERSLAKRLRAMRPEEATREIELFLQSDGTFREYQRHEIGLAFANWSLRQKQSFIRLLQLGLTIADSSTAQFWIKHTANRIGLRRLLNFCIAHATTDSPQIEFFIYWLNGKWLAEIERQKLQDRFIKLRQKTSAQVIEQPTAGIGPMPTEQK